jgi:hypothetical protein
LLTVLIGSTVQALVVASQQRRAIEQQHIALEEASNIMEQIMAQPWDRPAGSWQLSDGARGVLPAATVVVEVTPNEADDTAKKVTVEIRWSNRAGELVAPLRLVAWKYDLIGKSNQ